MVVRPRVHALPVRARPPGTNPSGWLTERILGGIVASQPFRRARTVARPSALSVAVRVVLSAAIALVTLPVLWLAPAYAAPSTIVADGDQNGLSNDWEGHASAPGPGFAIIRDGISPNDSSGFAGGNSEDGYDGIGNDKGWTFDSKGTPSGKSDIGNVLVDSHRDAANHLILALGWDRGAGTGTQNFWVELNQAAHNQIMPPRTKGDVRINMDINGSSLQECESAQIWTGSQWGTPQNCDSVSDFGVNAAPVRDYFQSGHSSGNPRMLPTNQFFELTIDLTALGATSCPVSGFSTFNMRTQEGNEDGESSRLKDLAQGPVDIPSDCGVIQIVKKDFATGERVTVPGTKFEVSPNPTAGAQDQTAKAVVDNNTAAAGLQDADPTVGSIKIVNVKPGVDYTVREIEAPTGYLLPPACATDAEDADACTKKTLGHGETVVFTFKDRRKYDAPEVTKTAVATYDAKYTWDIEKALKNPDGTFGESATQNVPEGTGATFDYQVTLTEKDEIKSGWKVAGSVSVKNPNSLPVTVTLTDTLSDGTVCTFPGVPDVSGAEGLQVSLPAGVTTDYAYNCSPGANPADGTNTAKVEWSKATYPQTQADVDAANPGTGAATGQKTYSYKVQTETNKTVTVTDTQHQWNGGWTKTWGEGAKSETRSYSKIFTGTPGTCTTYDNTATIKETGQDATAKANVCVGKDLTVTKNRIASLTRTYAFDIEKKAEDTTLDVDPATGKATANYTVTVTDGPATDSNWVMTGAITVANPNNWQDVTLTGITDAYNGDAASCEVDKAGGLVIPKGGSKRFDYTCTFTSKPSYTGTNVATVTWNKTAASTPSETASGSAGVVEADWIVAELDKTVEIVDDKTVQGASHSLGFVTWKGEGTKTPFTYSLSLQGKPGQCVDYTNTATVVETKASASETVTVCAPVGVEVEKTAAGTYDRTYKWRIDKQVDTTRVDIDGGQHTFHYTVTASPDGYADSGWTMGGTITVKNPNTFKTMTVDIADVPNVGGGAVCTVTNGEDVEIGKAALVNGQVVPATATRPYSCTFTSEPSYQGGTNTAVATWDGGSASSTPVPVDFTVGKQTHKTVTVVDDQTVKDTSTVLGTATWTAGPKSFEYSLTKTGVAGECTTYDNTATIVETKQTATASATLCVQKALEVSKTVEAGYERTYLWTIAKQADKTSFEIAEGGSAKVSYTVTAAPNGYVDGGWAMTGTITVKNPNSAGLGSITADIADSNTVGADCQVIGGDDVEIPAGATVNLGYRCTFPEDGPSSYDGTNTATATWTGTSGGARTAVGTADVHFAMSKQINDKVTVTDLFDDATVPGGGVVENLGMADWFAGQKEFTYSRDLAGVAGQCVVHDNTATIVETQQKANAQVTVCTEAALELDKSVTATYERTYHWSLDKAARQLDDVEVTDGSTGTFDYTVEVTPQLPGDSGHDDHDFAMHGTITVTNPNDYAGGSITADITDVPSVGGGAECEVEDGEGVEIAPGESVTLDYDCSFDARPSYSGTNKAVASWTGPTGAARSASSDAEIVTFALINEIDKTVTVYDDKTVPGRKVTLGEATWSPAGTPTRFTYELPLTGTEGRCTDFTNTATVPLEGSPDLSDEATVTLCVEGDALLANVVDASYDRSYAWSIAKQADGTRFDVDNDGRATVGYTVTAMPGAATDSGWTMNGALTVTNPNDYKSLTVDVATLTDLGGGATCILTPGQDLTVPASSSRTYTYGCSFTEQPAYSGTGTTKVTWDKGTVSIPSPVAFALDQETNKVVDVVDDQTVPGRSVALGRATWNAEGTPTPFSYTLDLAAGTNECVDYTNTATVVQTGASADATVTVCGPQILPAEETRPEPKPEPEPKPTARPRPPAVVAGLPDTGGPRGLLLWAGAGLVLAGGALMIGRGTASRRKLGS